MTAIRFAARVADTYGVNLPAPAQKIATTPAAPTPSAATVTPAAHEPEPPKTKTDITAAMPTFRWPVNGRVITAFGPKPSGQQNDGINVSVPEGTPIKAAEDGVVAYAGSELKYVVRLADGQTLAVRAPAGAVRKCGTRVVATFAKEHARVLEPKA